MHNMVFFENFFFEYHYYGISHYDLLSYLCIGKNSLFAT
jgi:hypothetical protein